MKIGKRGLAVVFLLVAIFVIGWLAFTSNRLKKPPAQLECYQSAVFVDEDKNILAFTDDGVWYKKNKRVLLLQIMDYSGGIITMSKSGVMYKFVAIDTETIYDERTTKIFIRRRGNGKN